MTGSYNISIHVPTRGTTYKRDRLEKLCRFQSTFPQGERQTYDDVPRDTTDFNPRSHKGNDSFKRACFNWGIDFNPRSHKGNDRHHVFSHTSQEHFNPRSHKGNDDGGRPGKIDFDISIHVPTRGTTRGRAAN